MVLKGDPELRLDWWWGEDDLPEDTGLILFMGGEPHTFAKTQKLIKGNQSIGSLRTQVHRSTECPVPFMFTYGVGMKEVDYAHYINMLTDVALAMRFMRHGTVEPVLGEYRYVDSFRELQQHVTKRWLQTGKPVKVALDTETLGLDRYNPDAWLLSLQMTAEEGRCDVVRFHSPEAEQAAFNDPDFLEAFVWLVTTPKVQLVMANGKYDINWIYERSGIHVQNFAMDTMIVGSLCDENRSNALDIHTKIMVPELGGYSDAFDRTTDKSRMDLVPDDKFLLYSGGDGDATLRVAGALRKELVQDKKLTNFYINLLHPAARAYEHVERVGVGVDQEAYRELEADLHAVVEKCKKAAKPLLGGRILAKHRDKKDLDKLNLTKPNMLIDYMFSPMGLNLKPRMFTEGSEEKYKKKEIQADERTPSATVGHLLMFDDVPEAKAFVDIMREYQSASKTLSTYVASRDTDGNIVKGFLKHLRADGRFHPAYWLHKGDEDENEGGTITGRLSARDPAFQTVPSHTIWAPRIRRCIIPPPGFLIAGGDYSQGELKVIACVANDHTMIKAYRDGKDLHVLTSSTYNGVPYDEVIAMKKSDPKRYKALRQDGKAGNFGLIYGMQAPGFVNYAWDSYGVRITLQNAETFRDTFFALYTRLLPYHDTYQAFAHEHEFVRSPLGRVRHLPLINSRIWSVKSKEERRAINSPIQSTLSDLSLLASAEAYKRGWHLEAPQFGMVHDQNLFYVPEDNPEFYCKRQKELMENLPLKEKFGWDHQLQFTTDFTVGPNLADQEEMEI